jgi:hypothetical protein
VFAPAYYDVLASRISEGRGGGPAHLHAVILALNTLRLGLPDLVWFTFRRSRRFQVTVLVVLVTLVGVLLRLGAGYGSAPGY